jgi:hypothetical protein
VEVFRKPQLSKKAEQFDLPVGDGEKWERVDGYPGYWISNKGRVYSEPRFNGTQGDHKGMMLSPTPQTEGYPAVKVWSDDGEECKLVHRLLMKAHGPEPPSPEHTMVNHIDGNIKNYDLDNLEWVKPYENQLHGGLRRLVVERGKRAARAQINDWMSQF